jgi:hypothetical protein
MQEAAFHVRLKGFRTDGCRSRDRPVQICCITRLCASMYLCVVRRFVCPARICTSTTATEKKKSCGRRRLRAGFVRSRAFFSCQRYIVVGRLFSEPRSARHRRAIGVRLRERLEPPSNLHQPCLVSLQACMFDLAPPNRHWAEVSLQVKFCS